MKKKIRFYFCVHILLVFFWQPVNVVAQEKPKRDNQATTMTSAHPSLILTTEGVKNIRAGYGSNKLFDKVVADAIAEVDTEIELGILVPLPKDMAGGYTHERHKRNWVVMQLAGNLYQITQQEKYAQYIKGNLLQYAAMYPTLPLHPTQKSYATEKIFWQCLNDANWLVYVSQAYDAIYNYLSK